MPSSSPESAEQLVPPAEEHLDQIARIEAESFVSPWRREHFERELGRGSIGCNRVLLRNGRVAGYFFMWIVEREAQINNIAVHPERRGAGLGRRLLRAAIDLARRRGCAEAILEVRPSNAAALALYRSEGFVEIGRRRGYYAAENEDAILLRAPIPRRSS